MKRFWTCLGAFLSLLAGATGLRGQTTPPPDYDPARIFNVKQIDSDFAVFRRILEQVHPALHRFLSRESLHATFEGARFSLNKPMTERDFACVLARVTSAIEDGHTGIYPSAPFARYLANRARILPWQVRYLRGRAYVVDDPTMKIQAGSELLAINGQTISTITDTLLDHLSGDGSIRTGKFRQLNSRFGYWYYRFVDPSQRFAVDYLDARTGKRSFAEVTGLTVGERKEAMARTRPDISQSQQKPLRIEAAPLPGTFVLTIESFAVSTEEFTSFLRDAFQKIRSQHTDDVIIDLRGNDGGDNFGPLLYSYLSDREFPYFEMIETSTNSVEPVRPYCRLDDEFVRAFRSQLVSTSNGRYRVKADAEPNLRPVKPQPEPYINRVWFLIDGDTFSSAATPCSVARSAHRGPFVGEETGGAYRGICGGNLVVITLPETKVRVAIPLQQYTMSVEPCLYPSRGIMPDYAVAPEIDDVLRKRDIGMNKTLELIKERRQHR